MKAFIQALEGGSSIEDVLDKLKRGGVHGISKFRPTEPDLEVYAILLSYLRALRERDEARLDAFDQILAHDAGARRALSEGVPRTASVDALPENATHRSALSSPLRIMGEHALAVEDRRSAALCLALAAALADTRRPMHPLLSDDAEALVCRLAFAAGEPTPMTGNPTLLRSVVGDSLWTRPLIGRYVIDTLAAKRRGDGWQAEEMAEILRPAFDALGIDDAARKLREPGLQRALQSKPRIAAERLLLSLGLPEPEVKELVGAQLGRGSAIVRPRARKKYPPRRRALPCNDPLFLAELPRTLRKLARETPEGARAALARRWSDVPEALVPLSDHLLSGRCRAVIRRQDEHYLEIEIERISAFWRVPPSRSAIHLRLRLLGVSRTDCLAAFLQHFDGLELNGRFVPLSSWQKASSAFAHLGVDEFENFRRWRQAYAVFDAYNGDELLLQPSGKVGWFNHEAGFEACAPNWERLLSRYARSFGNGPFDAFTR